MTKELGFVHRKSSDFGKVPSALFLDKSISHGAVRLYTYLHWRYGSNHQAFPNVETMASTLGVSERTINKWARELEAANWILVVFRTNKAGQRISNKYHVFEVQAECEEWRKRLKVDARKKPDERQERTGIGGKPTHKTESEDSNEAIGTQVPVDAHRNSSSDGSSLSHRNSSSDKPDSLIEPDSPYSGGEGENKPDGSDDYRHMQGVLVQKCFGGNKAKWGSAGVFANLFLARAENKAAQPFNLDVPMDRFEFDAFVLWYDDRKLAWPRAYDKLNQAVFDFRADKMAHARCLKRVRDMQAPKEDTPAADEQLMAIALQEVGNGTTTDSLAA